MFDISLADGYSFGTMLMVAAGAILLAGIFYYRAFRMLKRGQWQILFALRAVAILIVVLLLFRPVFSYYRDLEQRPAVVFLLDRSQSMSIADDATGVTRFNQARGQVERWHAQLKDDFDVYLFDFAERARRVRHAEEELPGLTPDGQATSLSRALVAATKLQDDEEQRVKPEAIILLSDGIHNSARSPLDWTSQMQLPVHTVGVGASLKSDVSYRDIQVAGIDCPDQMLLNNLAQIKASVEGVGLAGRVVQVILEEDKKQIAAEELTLDQVEGAQEVVFEFRPTTKGRHTYTIKVPPAGEEKIVQNNERSAISLVIEPGIRVLYIEGTVRAEYGALVHRFLAKDPDLEFCALVQTRPNFFLRRTNIPGLQLAAIPQTEEQINQFDVFILGDLDSTYFRGPQQQLIAKRIRQGAGLIMLGGYHSLGPGGYGGSPLGEILPVHLGSRDIGQVTDPFLPTLTPAGGRHPIFSGIAEFFPTAQAEPKVEGLPPLDGCTRVEGPRPSATVLATYQGDGGSMPVLAAHPVDKGRVAVFCGDTTRKWQQGPRAMDKESPFLRFWGQTVRWLAGRSTEVTAGASITASADKGYYEPDEPVKFSAIVRDDQGEGTTNAAVIARIRNPAGRPERVELASVPGPGGHYSGTFEPQTSGSFEIEIEATLGDKKLTAEKITIEVGRPNLEFEKLDLDEKMLGRIAADTGGRYVHITTADNLIDQLDRTQQKKRITFERQLYWPPLFWLLFVGVLTTEWILRKKFQLR